MQLQNYINRPQIQEVKKPDAPKSFAEVLKTSQAQQTNKTGFGNLISKATSENVKAQVVDSKGGAV